MLNTDNELYLDSLHLHSVQLSFSPLLLSGEIPQFVLYGSKKQEGFRRCAQPRDVSEGEQHCAAIGPAAPPSVAAEAVTPAGVGRGKLRDVGSHTDCKVLVLQSLAAHLGIPGALKQSVFILQCFHRIVQLGRSF